MTWVEPVREEQAVEERALPATTVDPGVDWLRDLGLVAPADRGGRAAPRRPHEFGVTEVAVLAGSALASFVAVWVLFYQLTLLSGALGFFICWYLTFLLVYWVATSQMVDRQAATDRTVTTAVASATLLVVGALLYIVGYVVWKGAHHFNTGFLYHTMANYQPAMGDRLFHTVGVGHAIVGTVEQVGLAGGLGVPLAFLTAIFLNEVGGVGVRFVRTVVTAMSGVPSVVAGIFIYGMFIITHVLAYSGFAASLALFVLLVPTVTRATEEVLRVVPGGLREASLALGASEWRTVWSVVLPTARSGLINAVILGVAIATGETAPLIFTAFGNSLMNADAFHGPQSALPLILWQNIFQAQPVVVQVAFTAGMVLLAIVLVLFVTARVLGARRPGGSRLRRLLSNAVRRTV